MLSILLLLLQSSPATCRDLAECRTEAQAAIARGDYEIFHDLAWRAVQKGTPNDPALMFLLARAQSLSGRPGDAIVMLGRIADGPSPAGAGRGWPADVLTSDDFRPVRLLPGWAALEARLTGALAPAPSAPVGPAPFAPRAPLAPSAPPSDLPFDAPPGLEPLGLARDAVSRRFVLGDRKAHRLLVIDEVSHHLVNYVSAESAGFYDEITAFTIDSRRGDLWVVSARGTGAEAASVLHKLQLVSGRGLLEARASDKAGPLRLVDVTVTPDGTVYALDAADSRIFRLKPGGRALEQVMRFDAPHPTALTAADDRILYVAADAGLVRVDVAARAAAPVKTMEELTGFESLSWRAGALIGVQRVAGSSLIARVALDASGVRAQPRHVLAASPTATVGALAGDAYYYLAEAGAIRRILLR